MHETGRVFTPRGRSSFTPQGRPSPRQSKPKGMRMMAKPYYFKGLLGILAALLMAVLPLLIGHTSPAAAYACSTGYDYWQYDSYCNPGPTTVALFEGQNQVGTAMPGNFCCVTGISITRPADNSTNNDGNIDVSGSIYSSSDSSTGWGGNWSISLTGVAEGTHTYYAYAYDYDYFSGV